MAEIRAIDASSVQKICCGQVIVDLATAVKELVENALDAGATKVEVKLRDFGCDSIEVSDNGDGVSPQNYASIARKHHTSKLTQFSDLENVSSFGFRGEALNALCELSKEFTVSTKQPQQTLGYQLSFDRSGRLTEEKAISRLDGTTVRVVELFAPLPVRRSEFIRNARKQYQKLIRVLQGYALVMTGVHFSVCHISKEQTRQNVITLPASKTLGDTIVTLFGAQFFSTLVPFSSSYDINGDTISYEGYVSRPGTGVGRSDSERQYAFCNKRPVDYTKLNKVFNEVWRRYEMSSKPAFVLHVTLPPGYIDVNLSPDKREVVIVHEKCLIDDLREVLDQLFTPSRSTLDTSHAVQRDITEIFSMSTLSKPNCSKSSVPTTSVSNSSTGGKSSCSGDEQSRAASSSLDVDTEENSLLCNEDCSDDESGFLEKRPKLSDSPDHSNVAFVQAPTSRMSSQWNMSIKDIVTKRTSVLSEHCISLDSISEEKLHCDINASMDEAADNLTRILSKEDFQLMRIIGQFNLGFIIAELRGDLYIIDQHASDEKYRFETLQKSTVIHRQPLLHPLLLELTAAEKLIIREHLAVFEANGFMFNLDSDDIYLRAVPFSKSVEFNQKDVRELASLIDSVHHATNEVSGIVLRNYDIYGQGDHIKLPKLASMFASRACRSAVMIGSALKYREMRDIVDNLSTIEQPWNCPHGRPTIRYLSELQKSACDSDKILFSLDSYKDVYKS